MKNVLFLGLVFIAASANAADVVPTYFKITCTSANITQVIETNTDRTDYFVSDLKFKSINSSSGSGSLGTGCNLEKPQTSPGYVTFGCSSEFQEWSGRLAIPAIELSKVTGRRFGVKLDYFGNPLANRVIQNCIRKK
jgi:hypothetical protein